MIELRPAVHLRIVAAAAATSRTVGSLSRGHGHELASARCEPTGISTTGSLDDGIPKLQHDAVAEIPSGDVLHASHGSRLEVAPSDALEVLRPSPLRLPV